MQKIYNFLLAVILSGILLSYPKELVAQTQPAKYNVLFITVHDFNDHIAFLGNPEAYTPNFNRLAAHGVVFQRNYCQYPLCSPSRTSSMSGWRPDHTGIFNNDVRPRTLMGQEVRFLPEYLHFYGYHTERYGTILQATFENDITWDYAEPAEEQAAGTQNISALQDTISWWVTSAIDSNTLDGTETRHLINRLKQPQTQPFFYALGLVLTHEPFTPNLINWNKNGNPMTSQHLPDKYGDTTYFAGNGSDNLLLPLTPVGDRNDMPKPALPNPSYTISDYEWRRIIHAYEGELSQMDIQIGLLLDELDRQHLWDNTIVVFCPDHGQHLGEHEGTWFKMTLFEESLHLPLIICAPGKQAAVCTRLTENVDLYATLADLCGLPLPPGLEGVSLVPLLDNPQFAWKRAVFAQVKRTETLMGRSVITEQFKYNSWGVKGEELYDHIADPHEYTNLVGNPDYAAALSQMKTFLSEGWTKSLPPAYQLQTFYRDFDMDGYGSMHDSIITYALLPGYTSGNTDCNDSNKNIHPGVKEICNGFDDNCDGRIDEGKPVPSITAIGSLDICEAGSVMLRTNYGVSYLYQWKKNGTNITGATKRNYTASDTGKYTVLVSNKTGCSSLSKSTTVINSCKNDHDFSPAMLALNQFTKLGRISIYPNPASQKIIVLYNGSKSAAVKFNVFDITGKAVFNISEQAIKGANTFYLDLSQLSHGFYLLEMNDNHNKSVTKFLLLP